MTDPTIQLGIIIISALVVSYIAANSSRLIKYVIYKILSVVLRKPAKNMVTGNTADQRVREYICKTTGCVTTGRYYRLPQARCRRCGHKNKNAADYLQKWEQPDQ